MFFIRTEETKEKAEKALERNQSIRRWAYIGAHPEEHFLFAITGEERIAAMNKLGFEVEYEDEALEVFTEEVEGNEDLLPALIEALNLTEMTEMEAGGYAEFLPGLCALEKHEEEPKPEDCTVDLNGHLFPYLVCYEGEEVGTDPDEDWTLFRAARIAWIAPTGATGKRERNI